MAKSQENTAAATANTAANAALMGGFGDLSVIRNILFGQQVAEFNSEFEEFRGRMDKTDADNEARFRELEAAITKRIDNMEKDVYARFARLEAALQQSVADLGRQLAETSTRDRDEMGRYLIEIGQRLSK